MKLNGISALVTGGASGLGRATAQALSAAGASVVIFDLPTSAGEAVAAEIGATFSPGDVTSEDDVQAAIERAGDLRVAVSCAGVGTPGRILSRKGPLPLDAYRRVIEINLVGTFNVLRLAAARMTTLEPIDGECGVIINTASVAAFEGQIGQAAYASSKAGIAGLTICAARDLSDGMVRVATIAPGIIDTPLLAGLDDEFRRRLAENVPHPRRLGRPDEYASLVCHIIDNQMINGETIRLDAALRMAPR